jgi:uncharacterized protein DUF3300
MKRWIAPALFSALLISALAIWQAPAQAQARVYSQAELDALLAPVALYPDPVLSHILVAATYPDDLRQAAAWSRANSHLTGEDAVRAAETMPWQPSVKALVAFPELLARMDESPQWTADLGTAVLEQEPYVMDTVQGLRRRAQASGYLQSDPQQQVYQQGQDIAVYPAQPQMVYVPYYNPYVVYGPWWWPAYRPVFWRPWYARPAVFVSTRFFVTSVDWRHRHVVRPGHRIHSAAPVTIHNHAHPVRPVVDSVRIQPQAVQIQPQPAAQLRRSEARREFQRDRRVQASPPVVVHGQTQALRPIVDPVRTHQQLAARAAQSQVRSEFQHPTRPTGQSGHARQPHRQVEQRRR